MDWRTQLKPGDSVRIQGSIVGIVKTFTIKATRENHHGRLQVKIGDNEWLSASCVHSLATAQQEQVAA